MKKIQLNPLGVLLCFAGLTVISLLIFGQLGVFIASLVDPNFSVKEILTVPVDIELLKNHKSALYIFQVVSTIGGFLIPGLLISLFVEGYEIKKFAHLVKANPILLLISASILFYGALICIGLLHEINELFPISEFWTTKEMQNIAQQNALIEGHGIGALLTSLFVVALLPALLEEFAFRGVALHILEKTLRNKHIAISIQGILFGLMHFNVSQMLPIIGMGIMFGYLTYATKSIWYSVLIHFLNNSLAVIALFYAKTYHWAEKMNANETLPYWQYGLGVILLCYGLYLFFKYTRKNNVPNQLRTQN